MPSSPSRRSPRPVVPVFEPEILIAKAMRDPEKVASTGMARLTYRGVLVSSQRKRAIDYEVMMDVLDRVPKVGLQALAGIGCMSPGWNFLLVIHEKHRESSVNLAKALEARIILCNGGHDGVLVTVGRLPSFRLQRWWEIAPEQRR